MGKALTFFVLAIAAFAIDAYAFGGHYADYAKQQGRIFGWEVQYQLKKIGI
jgi:hypothetical protein